jgi:hypothetical protein
VRRSKISACAPLGSAKLTATPERPATSRARGSSSIPGTSARPPPGALRRRDRGCGRRRHVGAGRRALLVGGRGRIDAGARVGAQLALLAAPVALGE